MIKKIPSPSSDIGWINFREEHYFGSHLHSQSFLSSYELSRVFNPFASEAVSARCSAISLEYFSPSDSVVHTFSNLGSVVVIFARRGGTLQRDGSRERERVHSLKTFHGIHSKCTPSKCDARGSNARTLAKRRRIFLSFLFLSLSLWHVETTS